LTSASRRHWASLAATCRARGDAKRRPHHPDYGGRPVEHAEGYRAGWQEFDDVFRTRLGETTLVLPAGGRSASEGVLAGHELTGLPTDGEAAVNLVLAKAIGLAQEANWNFRLIYDSGTAEEHFYSLQDLNPCKPDIAWLFEHFSVMVVEPGASIVPILDEEEIAGFARGIVYVGTRSVLLPQDADAVERCARRTGACVCISSSCASLGTPQPHDLQLACDNCLTVRPLDELRLEVVPQKLGGNAALWPRMGPGPAAAFKPVRLRRPRAEARLAT